MAKFVDGSIGTGAEAVLKLCETLGLDIQPLTEINIPLDVYFESNPCEWNDVCALAARVCNRANRVAMLLEMKAPEVIMFNEKRMLYECIRDLEHNNAGNGELALKRNDGTVLRSLYDIGYSLTEGWNEEMKEEFEKRANEPDNSKEEPEE